MGRRAAAPENEATTEDPQKLEEKLHSLVPKIFDDAQTSTLNHRKNIVKLYKLQVEAAKCQVPVKKGGSMKLVGESLFNATMLHMINRVVVVKKGVRQADNIGKFIGEFIKHVNEKGS